MATAIAARPTKALLAFTFTKYKPLANAETFKCPRTGGDFVFGQEANINTLDQMTSATISTRNIAMNIYETLMTRDENNNPILELAAAMNEAPDHLTYTFKLRDGIKFHNGKAMTSADCPLYYRSGRMAIDIGRSYNVSHSTISRL